MYPNTNNQGETIERFHIPGGDGYSDFWRRNKSPIEIVELANLLQSLRKIASYVGRNVGTVVWSGMDLSQAIAINPKPVMGQYPIPAARTDIMVGLTIQCAYVNTEWSDRLKKLAFSQIELPSHYMYKFDLFLDMCEKVYLDILSNRSILGIYTEKARQWTIQERSKQFIQPPTVTELLHIWWKMAADISGQGHKQDYVDQSVGGLVERSSLEKFYKQPLALLNSIIDQLITGSQKIKSVTERGAFRLNLYLSIWPSLLEHIKFWPTDRADPFLIANNFEDDIAEEDEELEAIKATISSHADKLERVLNKKHADFTEDIKSIVINVEDVVPIAGNDIVMKATNKINKSLYHRLQQEFKKVSQRKTYYNRGLKTGRIDRRRLYRASTTGTIFQLKENDYQLQNDIVLLVDATGSMSDPNKWEKTETIFQTLFSVILDYNKNARLFAYNEVRETCFLTELYFGGKFYTVLPNGQTASGEVIIATALNLKIGVKKPFIIHVTDGASNWGCGVDEAIRFCKKKRIKLLTLGIGCDLSNKQSLREEYGRLVQFVDNMDDLPNLFKSLLKYSTFQK